MIRNFSDIIAINEKKYEFGCLMAELSFQNKNWMTDVLKMVDEADLYKDPAEPDKFGLEYESHVTVLYG